MMTPTRQVMRVLKKIAELTFFFFSFLSKFKDSL